MQIKYLAACLVTLTASTALSDARIELDQSSITFPDRFVMAQATLDTITDSDLRRLTYYNRRALDSLLAVVESASSRDIIEQSRVNGTFRTAISRLVDAGKRSGLSVDVVAMFFVEAVTEEFGQDFMQRVGQVAGGLDVITLFRNVSNPMDPRTSNVDNGMTFLNALAQASEDLDLTREAGDEPAASATAAEPAASAGPRALPNASGPERIIVDRIVVEGDEWSIVVRSGDSLALFASAIYGDSLAYNVIYQANRNVLSNPNTLNIGIKIIIPKP